jgi:hypothetical protein
MPQARREWSREEKRRYAEQRRAARATKMNVEYWRDALIAELNARKIAMVDAGDFVALEPAARLCKTLENGPAADVNSRLHPPSSCRSPRRGGADRSGA